MYSCPASGKGVKKNGKLLLSFFLGNFRRTAMREINSAYWRGEICQEAEDYQSSRHAA